ncbi:outer membrane protein OmpA-like peptidoglycan-associated protein [Dyadobacter jejuensis]|uniref:Outer membrane protein OmpA-like peptidoglycan-associated protein n=2 Tax=Dyadobacter jejuensis TaxID=1082580 RepID=A0A316AJD5_9BACT|nr:OmpA family protein [Dyadobacter jejuensis]PWJ57731.1 outer membrane protein OmpA-like peptidoglycan-associated protein [Dyadobacter jejuensis]
MRLLRSALYPLSCLILTALLLASCNSPMQVYKDSLKKFDNGEYDLAIKGLQKAKEAGYEANQSNYLIAEGYRLSNRPAESIPYYKEAVGTDLERPEAQFHYAYALKSTGAYAEAKEQFQAFAAKKDVSKPLQERALREIEILKIIDRLKTTAPEVEITNLPINTAGAEFSALVRGQELVFSSSKKEKVYKNNGQAMLGLYKAALTSDPENIQGPATLLSKNIFEEEANEGSPAFSPDGKTLIFARGNTGKKKGTADVHLFMSKNIDGDWTPPAYLPINDSLSWDGSPAFSSDGKTLYFASNRPGGSGGIDLYRTNMDASGRFSKPVNMGKDINTAGDEMFPYVSEDAKLYFASDGHPGLGGLDLFVATRSQGIITVKNLGLPYNSPQDDFALSFYPDLNAGFLSSNRTGGKGDDDLYYFYTPQVADSSIIAKVDDPTDPMSPNNVNYINGKPKVVRYFLAGEVVTNSPEATPIDSAIVHILPDTSDVQIAELPTDAYGKFGTQPVEEGRSYVLLVSRKGYISKREPFTMDGKSIPPIFLNKELTDTTYSVTVRLDKLELNKTFVLDNIYYDLNKYNIRPDAAVELDKLVQILNDNPTMTIELSSHTDARATDSYNLTLSQNRAESAVNYLNSKGIDADRMVAQGYGERELLIENAKTEEEHQKNRRTEFTILSY